LGMLTKWTFALCVLVPLLLMIGQAVVKSRQERSWRRPILIGAAGLLAYVVSSFWYITNLQQFRIDMNTNGAHQALLEGDPAVGSLASNLWYLNNLIDQQLFLIGLGLFGVGLLLCLRQPKLRSGLIYPLATATAVLILFTLLPNKDARYTLPALPFIALISVAWISALRSYARTAATLALLAYAGIMFMLVSFGSSIVPSQIMVSLFGHPSPIYSQRGYIIGPPTRENWGLTEVFQYLSCQPPEQRSLSFSGQETIWLNGWDIIYYRQLYQVGDPTPNKANYLLIRSATVPVGGSIVMSRTLPDQTHLTLIKQ
jgi:hypothetical protein